MRVSNKEHKQPTITKNAISTAHCHLCELALDETFLECPTLVNVRDHDQQTAMHIAVVKGQRNICKHLVQRVPGSIDWMTGTGTSMPMLWSVSADKMLNLETLCRLQHYLWQPKKHFQPFGHWCESGQSWQSHCTAFGGMHESVRDCESTCKLDANVNVEDRWGHCPLDCQSTFQSDNGLVHVHVSICFIRIVSFLSVLNDMELWQTNIGNTYLEAKSSKYNCILTGPESLIIIKALYGLCTSGKMWHIRFAECLKQRVLNLATQNLTNG